jgi:phosphoenolpyruvate-protein phosphotransferase (PTS system enzyme I)
VGAVTPLRGAPAAAGRAAGPLFVVEEPAAAATAATAGLDAVRAAAERAAGRLEQLGRRRREGSPAAADILDAQAMILRDPALEAEVERRLPEQPAAAAVEAAARHYADELAALDDPYLSARAADILEAGRLLVAELEGRGGSRLAGLDKPAVVAARELSPADLLSADAALLLAVVTETGGLTSHAAIVARELGIPAVVGVEGLLAAARTARAAEVDGGAGEVRLLAEVPAAAMRGTQRRRLPVERAPVRLMANVGSARAAEQAAARGAAGVGLFRTELLYLGEASAPSEDRQAAEYAAACRALAPHPVTVRTLDAGSDKALPYLAAPPEPEPNPALGRRGIRLWLAHRELWEPQVRALLRVAAEHHNLRVLLPMVATPDELREARARFRAEARRRRAAAVPPLGVMVELPAVAAALAPFRGHADFVSLGTNDLTQYALGADRELAWDAALSELHPGVLRLVAGCLAEAAALGLEAGVCGELAGVPAGAVFLAGAGATSLSMGAGSLPAVLRALVRLGLDGCRARAQAALAAPDAVSARRALRSRSG